MRILHRNTVPIWYALHKDTEMLTDEWGNYTGEYDVGYETPVMIRANVSSAKNVVHYAAFGTDIRYDKTLTLCDTSCPITENSVIWIEHEPVINADGTTDTPFEYTVNKIAKWKNSLLIAIEAVDVS